jgi:hypothetical protein
MALLQEKKLDAGSQRLYIKLEVEKNENGR